MSNPTTIMHTQDSNVDFSKSRQLQQRMHQIVPGGCHTYAKGDDQYPLLAPGFIHKGKGCYVWDTDGNQYVEYGMGCRAVGLGHAFEPVLDAVRQVYRSERDYAQARHNYVLSALRLHQATGTLSASDLSIVSAP